MRGSFPTFLSIWVGEAKRDENKKGETNKGNKEKREKESQME